VRVFLFSWVGDCFGVRFDGFLSKLIIVTLDRRLAGRTPKECPTPAGSEGRAPCVPVFGLVTRTCWMLKNKGFGVLRCYYIQYNIAFFKNIIRFEITEFIP
jgi:hypothetical protein